MIRSTIGLVVAALLLAFQATTLETVLARAGEYVTAFRQRAALLIADETNTQVRRPYGSSTNDLMSSGTPLGQMGTPTVRKLRSELALFVALVTDDWQAFRDVVEVDGKPLRAERDRLLRLLTDPQGPDVQAARALTAESLRHDLSTMAHDLTGPTFPLVFLSPRHQQGVRFTKKGERKAGGLPVWVVEFVETTRPLARMADGTPQPSRGEFWIDPTNGRVVRSRLVFDTLDAIPDMKQHPERYLDFPHVTFEVTYRMDQGLDMWVPVEMKEFYNRRAEAVTCTITYSNLRLMDTAAK